MITVQLLSQRGPAAFQSLASRFPNGTLEQKDFTVQVDDNDVADLVIVQNYLKYDRNVTARRGMIFKWDNEPIVRLPFARGYDRIYTHIADSGDNRVVAAPPVLDWWVGKSFDELTQLTPPNKTGHISAIASTKAGIPGHIQRRNFVREAQQKIPSLDVFGRGQDQELADKWDGLAPYRFSLAIENTSKDDYWTEKISDCFLSYTVPLYWGATNISEYFPKDSFIWLPVDKPDEAIDIIRETLAKDDWDKRLPALIEARTRVLKRYSLHAQVTRLIEENRAEILTAPMVTKKVRGRRTRPGGWIRGAGIVGNVRARLNRRNARLLSAHSYT